VWILPNSATISAQSDCCVFDHPASFVYCLCFYEMVVCQYVFVVSFAILNLNMCLCRRKCDNAVRLTIRLLFTLILVLLYGILLGGFIELCNKVQVMCI